MSGPADAEKKPEASSNDAEASKEAKPAAKLEEDDEFEDFPAEGA
jgi:hypothetical protein